MTVDPERPTNDTRGSYEAELAGLYTEYYDKIAHYASVHIGNKADAEDIAGEVFLKALESLGSYEKRGIPMQAWLFKIAHNLVVDYLRRVSKRKTIDIDSVTLRSDESPEMIAEINIEVERIKKAMEQLTREQREVLSLRFFGELTSKETAAIMGKSDGAVREMQRAATSRLRVLLAVE
ncbi:MAG: sigma-70 family RNA polymerase sigma factor [Dehalococcoidia bacterium]|nr:MAG: sigma-70 family RNA polymerase sigma factor [Dehalococcoidia bacterium]